LLDINDGKIKINRRDLEHLRAQYQENLAYADHYTGRVIEFLRSHGLLDKTLLIVTSDHGEAFREHGVLMHNTTVYEEMIHVPLVIRFPPRYGKLPSRWSGVVELTDLLPTICHALHIQPPAAPGRSLLRLLHAGDEAATFARSWTSMAPQKLAALVLSRHKLIADYLTRKVQLFDLENDPHETKDVGLANRPLVEKLVNLLQKEDTRRLTIEEAKIDEATLQKLRSLGYVR
jgi:arylsulfatase A-like enzyme